MVNTQLTQLPANPSRTVPTVSELAGFRRRESLITEQTLDHQLINHLAQHAAVELARAKPLAQLAFELLRTMLATG